MATMSGNDRGPLIAWDTCVFLAHFNQEADKPLEEIKGILDEVAKGKKALLVSAIVRAEVLNKVGKSNAGTQICEFCKRSQVAMASADFRIADEAAAIRERVFEEMAAGRMKTAVKAPDALIVATAILYKATALHTFDPVLLGLSGHSAVKELAIVQPGSGLAHGQPLFPGLA
jgi:predicted nucleic acid-binding protein